MPSRSKTRALTLSLLLLLVFCLQSHSRELITGQTASNLRHTSSLRPPNEGQTSRSSSTKPTEVRGKERIRLQWNVKGLTTILDGVPVWSEKSERLVPEGFSDHHVHQWQEETRNLQAKEVRLNHCGRPPNALVILEDGRMSCCRPRVKGKDSLIMGDVYSFALSRLLGMHHVPSTILTDLSSRQWQVVSPHALNNRTELFPFALLTEWINNLDEAYVPHVLMRSEEKIQAGDNLANLSSDDIRDLIQWTDMLIFDYLTVNTDRMINLLYNKHWNARIVEHPVHNLHKDKEGLLIFIDNESGMIKGQQLFLDTRKDYHSLYNRLLNRTCVFRRRTVERIRGLSRSQGVGKQLNDTLKHMDPLAEELGSLAKKYTDGLQSRIDHVYSYMKSCLSV